MSKTVPPHKEVRCEGGQAFEEPSRAAADRPCRFFLDGQRWPAQRERGVKHYRSNAT